jgi:uroporphyrinogen-III synthase
VKIGIRTKDYETFTLENVISYDFTETGWVTFTSPEGIAYFSSDTLDYFIVLD